MTHARLTEATDETAGIVRAAADAVVDALRARDTTLRRLQRRVVHIDGTGDGDDVRIGFDVVSVASDGTVHDDVVWAARVDGVAPPGTVVVPTAFGEFGVWRHPNDPVLPGLAGVVAGRCDVVAATGIEVTAVEIVGMTPLGDATVRVGRPGHAVFVKVVAPGAATPLADVHHRLLDAGVPVPPVLGVDEPSGLVVLGALPGRPLADRLTSGHPVPEPAEVRELIARLAGTEVGRDSSAEALSSTLARACARVTAADPDLTRRVDELHSTLREDSPHPYPATVHGDLHDRQLLVDDSGRISGVVDLDRVGTGDLADDLGRLLAHVRIRALTTPGRRDAITAVADDWRRALGGLVGDDQLRHRSAVSLVGLATGPWRTGEADWHDTLTGALDDAATLLR